MSNSVMKMPNGLALSPDESVLYVADSSSSPTSGGNLSSFRNIWAFDYRHGMLKNPRLIHLVESGWPDGLRVTEHGFLMAAVSGGVEMINPANGLLLGKINTPGDIIFNLEPARGQPGGVWLFTGKKNIYKLVMSERATVYPAGPSSIAQLVNQAESYARSGWDEIRRRFG